MTPFSIYRGIPIYKISETKFSLDEHGGYPSFNSAWDAHYYIDELKSP